MKGKAAVFYGPGKPMEIREFSLPDPEPGAILVKVSLANICGSDLHIWRGEVPWRALPTIFGHEMTGTVYRLGAGVKVDSHGQPLAEGDRVIYPYFFFCGHCYACLSGNRAACPNKYADWVSHTCEEPPHFIGAYGDYYYLRPHHFVFKVPDGLSDEMVAPLNCALSEVIYGLHQVGVHLGDTVAIQGAGGLGVYACAVAKDMGAGQVIVLDRFEDRLKLARAFGADHAINVSQLPDPRERVQRVRELTGGRGADVVAELVGSPRVIPEGISMLRVGGSYLLIGNISRGLTVEFDPSTVVSFSRRLVGVVTYEPWALARSLEFLQRTRDKYPFDQVLSHKFPLEQINEAFQQADQGKVTRAALVPNRGG